jgi:hypothetical protein
MLPIGHKWKEGSMTELIETAPQMGLVIQDIEHLVAELRAYHAIYSPLFQRREQRDAAHIYLQGLLAALPRKSIEPLVWQSKASPPRRCGPYSRSFVRGGGPMSDCCASTGKKGSETWGQTRGS